MLVSLVLPNCFVLAFFVVIERILLTFKNLIRSENMYRECLIWQKSLRNSVKRKGLFNRRFDLGLDLRRT